MKKIILLLAFAPIFFACSKDEPDVVASPSIDNPADVTKIGDKVSNPKNIQLCKNPEEADATLSSLRHISDVLYTMNYTADLHLDELVNGDYRTRDAFENAFADFMFTPEGGEPVYDAAPQACSGFVCNTQVATSCWVATSMEGTARCSCYSIATTATSMSSVLRLTTILFSMLVLTVLMEMVF